jgi:hypothetical protein
VPNVVEPIREKVSLDIAAAKAALETLAKIAINFGDRMKEAGAHTATAMSAATQSTGSFAALLGNIRGLVVFSAIAAQAKQYVKFSSLGNVLWPELSIGITNLARKFSSLGNVLWRKPYDAVREFKKKLRPTKPNDRRDYTNQPTNCCDHQPNRN